jgi:carbon monoxide dehydrogenase subunit G
MRIEHQFRVDAPPEAVWPLLLDVERVAPCLPGAETPERVDERTYKVGVSVALGPMKLVYRGELAIEEVDEELRRTVMEARATETRGQGTVRATIRTTLTAEDGGTRADVVTDLQLTGRVAQMGHGIVEDVSRRLLGDFASCLGRRATADRSEADPPVETARPIRGLWLLGQVVLARLRRLFGGSR